MRLLYWSAMAALVALTAAHAAEIDAASPAPQGALDLVYLGDVPPEGGAPRRSDFIDANAVRRNGDIAAIWTFRVYWPATARTAADAAAVWHRFHFDCALHTVTQTAIVVLDENLDVIAQNERPAPARNIVPGSATAVLADIGCGTAELPESAPRFGSVAGAFAAPRGISNDAGR